LRGDLQLATANAAAADEALAREKAENERLLEAHDDLSCQLYAAQCDAERLREALDSALPYLHEHVGCEIQEDAAGCDDCAFKVARALLTRGGSDGE